MGRDTVARRACVLKFPERISVALAKLPTDLRATAEENIAWLKTRVEISPRALGQLLADAAAEPRARATSAWLAGLTREKALISQLEAVVASAPPNEVLWEAAKALCAMGQGATLFRRLLRQATSPDTQHVAAYALGRLRNKAAAKDLCWLLEHPEETSSLVRGQAAEALGYLGLKRSIPSLLRATRDDAPDVRFWAAFALGELEAFEAEKILETLSEQDHAHIAGWWQVSKEAADALDKIRRAKRRAE